MKKKYTGTTKSGRVSFDTVSFWALSLVAAALVVYLFIAPDSNNLKEVAPEEAIPRPTYGEMSVDDIVGYDPPGRFQRIMASTSINADAVLEGTAKLIEERGLDVPLEEMLSRDLPSRLETRMAYYRWLKGTTRFRLRTSTCAPHVLKELKLVCDLIDRGQAGLVDTLLPSQVPSRMDALKDMGCDDPYFQFLMWLRQRLTGGLSTVNSQQQSDFKELDRLCQRIAESGDRPFLHLEALRWLIAYESKGFRWAVDPGSLKTESTRQRVKRHMETAASVARELATNHISSWDSRVDFGHSLLSVVGRFQDSMQLYLAEALAVSPEVDPYVAALFCGRCYRILTRLLRRGRVPSAMPEKEWSDVQNAGRLAHLHWSKAWQLEPSCSMVTSWLFSNQSFTSAGPHDPGVWFNATLSTGRGISNVTGSVGNYMAPEWGGSFPGVLRLARQLGESPTIHTDIPYEGLCLISAYLEDVGAMEYYKHPEHLRLSRQISRNLQNWSHTARAEELEPHLYRRVRCQLLAVLLMNGDLKEVIRLAKALPDPFAYIWHHERHERPMFTAQLTHVLGSEFGDEIGVLEQKLVSNPDICTSADEELVAELLGLPEFATCRDYLSARRYQIRLLTQLRKGNGNELKLPSGWVWDRDRIEFPGEGSENMLLKSVEMDRRKRYTAELALTLPEEFELEVELSLVDFEEGPNWRVEVFDRPPAFGLVDSTSRVPLHSFPLSSSQATFSLVIKRSKDLWSVNINGVEQPATMVSNSEVDTEYGAAQHLSFSCEIPFQVKSGVFRPL